MANFKSCTKAAILTGTYPCDDQYLLGTIFVRKVSPHLMQIVDERKKRKKKETLNINNKLISEDDLLEEINDFIRASPKHSYLCYDNYTGNYADLIPLICSEIHNNCHFLGRVPPFIDKELKVNYFWMRKKIPTWNFQVFFISHVKKNLEFPSIFNCAFLYAIARIKRHKTH